MRETIKKNKGITLIALVVTIIVLLILAAVTISLVLGQNGIIGKANQAKTITPQKEAEEAIKLVLGEWKIEKYTGTMTLKEFLESKVPNELDSVTGEEAPFEVEKNGYVGAVNADGLLDGEVQKAGPRPQISDIKITTDGTTVPEDNSVQSGTALQITFTHSIEGGTTTVSPELPYTTDGTEMSKEFIITGTVDGQTYTKKVTISVESKYKVPMPEIGDFINYDAGTWTEDEISELKVGRINNLVAANASTTLPVYNLQFGGFKAGMSRNENATPSASNYTYIKETTSDGKKRDVTGWRVFDITDDGKIILISAGCPEDYCHVYTNNNAYISEYILTGNKNENWSEKDTAESTYNKRDWSKYVNKSQGAANATAIAKDKLDVWYSKYKDKSLIDNYSYYWLASAKDDGMMYFKNPINSR